MSGRFADLPKPPYYAVIFTNQRSDFEAGYAEMSDKMVEMAALQPGYIGVESTRDEAGLGITVSYWRDEPSLLAWKAVAEHAFAQKMGKEKWYDYYITRIAKVERHYDGPEGR
jgi:heme-degrading monooxygenase HmoA